MFRYLLAAAAAMGSCAFAASPTPTPIKPNALKLTQGTVTRTLPVNPPCLKCSYNEILQSGQRKFTGGSLGGNWTQFPQSGGPVSIEWVAPAATCPAIPADASQDVPCANGAGTWRQTHGWTQSAPPTCLLTALAWTPTTQRPTDCQAVSPPPGGLTIDLSYVNRSSPEYTRFIGQAARDDATVSDMLYASKLTGDPSYCARAVQNVEQQVSAAEANISGGRNPDVAGDSYLYVDGYIGDVALAYAWCTTTISQKTRWGNYAAQAIYNVWHPGQAKWGGRSAPWSGWATDDPQNNYHYHFVRATEYWALASGDTALLAELTATRWPFVVNAMASIPGGGSLEGTGYGYAHGNLFLAYETWRDSGHGDIGNSSTHLANSARFWVHATVPTLDRFAPIGDQARISEPLLYDYQRTVVLLSQFLSHDAVSKAEAGWWLKHIPVQEMYRGNYIDNLFPYTPTDTPPAALTYRAPEVGAIFARTAWNPQATWFAFLAGRFEQSHAAREQGGFTLFGKGDWLTVTNNIHSHSGIQQGSRDRNIPRFVKGGQVKEQDYAAAIVTAYTPSANGDVHIAADLSPLYQIDDNMGVQRWNRTADFIGGSLTITDAFTLASGTSAIEQIQLPTQPTVAGNIITAGHLRVTVISPANAQITVVPMTSVDSDYASGYRAEFSANGGAVFRLDTLP